MFFDKVMHFIKELGTLLDFINDEQAIAPAFRFDLLAESRRICLETKKQSVVQQAIHLLRNRQDFMSDVSGFPCLSWPKQKYSPLLHEALQI